MIGLGWVVLRICSGPEEELILRRKRGSGSRTNVNGDVDADAVVLGPGMCVVVPLLGLVMSED